MSKYAISIDVKSVEVEVEAPDEDAALNKVLAMPLDDLLDVGQDFSYSMREVSE